MKAWWSLEPHPDFDELALYKHDEYGRGSVLEGQERRTFMGTFVDVEAAQEAFPDAEIEVSEGSTKRDLVLPDTPPSWFDPLDAGEEW